MLAGAFVPHALTAQETTAPSAGLGAVQPYKLVAVKPPENYADASYAAFRKELAELAQRRIYAELTRIVVTGGFFWERDFAGAYDAKRSATENLAAAIGLERGSGGGWQWLADTAADGGASPMPSRPGVLCAPGQPQFEAFEFDWLLEVTRSAATDWGYPRTGGADVRAQAREKSAVVETIGSHFVRLLTVPSKEAEPHRTWARVATPAGRTGFVAPGVIAAAYPARLCYAKDTLGRWRIVGFVGAGD
jgi:hypothetical protein